MAAFSRALGDRSASACLPPCMHSQSWHMHEDYSPSTRRGQRGGRAVKQKHLAHGCIARLFFWGRFPSRHSEPRVAVPVLVRFADLFRAAGPPRKNDVFVGLVKHLTRMAERSCRPAFTPSPGLPTAFYEALCPALPSSSPMSPRTLFFTSLPPSLLRLFGAHLPQSTESGLYGSLDIIAL